MQGPSPDWEYEFRIEFPGSSDAQVREAWQRERNRGPAALDFASLADRMDWHQRQMELDGSDRPDLPYMLDDGGGDDPPAAWELEHGAAPEPSHLGGGRIAPSDLEAIADAEQESESYRRWRAEEDERIKDLLRDGTPAEWERYVARSEPPMRVGATLPDAPAEVARHEADRHRPRLAELDVAHDDPQAKQERDVVTQHFGRSYIVEHDPEHWRRTGTGRTASRSSAVRIRDGEGGFTYRLIANDTAAITEWLCRDGRKLEDWDAATAPGRRSADALALRAELATKVHELVSMGANRGAVAQVLGRSSNVVRSLLR